MGILSSTAKSVKPQQYFLSDNGTFPNSHLPVLLYKNILRLPLLFPALAIKRLFSRNGWTNNWRNGIYTYNHYHSVTHEAMAVCKGDTTLQLGGEEGTLVSISKGDVIIIPAGVAHKNIGEEQDVICVGGYPGGKDFDMNYGREGERPQTDSIIAAVPLPSTDPILGENKGLAAIWQNIAKRK